MSSFLFLFASAIDLLYLTSITTKSVLSSRNFFISSSLNLPVVFSFSLKTLRSFVTNCFLLSERTFSLAPEASNNLISPSRLSFLLAAVFVNFSKDLSASFVIPTKSVTLVTKSPKILPTLAKPGIAFRTASLIASKFATIKPNAIAKAPTPVAIKAPLIVVKAVIAAAFIEAKALNTFVLITSPKFLKPSIEARTVLSPSDSAKAD